MFETIDGGAVVGLWDAVELIAFGGPGPGVVLIDDGKGGFLYGIEGEIYSDPTPCPSDEEMAEQAEATARASSTLLRALRKRHATAYARKDGPLRPVDHAFWYTVTESMLLRLDREGIPGAWQDGATARLLIPKADIAPLMGAAANASAAAPPSPAVSRAVPEPKLIAWIREMLDLGRTGRELEKMRRTAFPGRCAPSRDRVLTIYRGLFQSDFSVMPPSGAIHPSLADRRKKSGLASE